MSQTPHPSEWNLEASVTSTEDPIWGIPEASSFPVVSSSQPSPQYPQYPQGYIPPYAVPYQPQQVQPQQVQPQQVQPQQVQQPQPKRVHISCGSGGTAGSRGCGGNEAEVTYASPNGGTQSRFIQYRCTQCGGGWSMGY